MVIAQSASHVLEKDGSAGGDIRQAVEVYSQSLLIKLSNAYDIAAIVQIPVDISEARFSGEPVSDCLGPCATAVPRRAGPQPRPGWHRPNWRFLPAPIPMQAARTTRHC